MTPRRLPSPGQDRRRGPSVARAPTSRTRYPSRYNSRYAARVALARPARGARGSERRQAPGHRRRHQRRTDGRTRTRGAARSAILDHAPFSPCSPYQTMLEYANMCKNTLSYLQMFADILRFRKEIKKFDFFAIWACAGARNVVRCLRFRIPGSRTPAEECNAEIKQSDLPALVGLRVRAHVLPHKSGYYHAKWK